MQESRRQDSNPGVFKPTALCWIPVVVMCFKRDLAFYSMLKKSKLSALKKKEKNVGK